MRCMNPVDCLRRDQSGTSDSCLATLDPDTIAAQDYEPLSSGQQADLQDGLAWGSPYLSIWEVQHSNAIGFDLEIAFGGLER